MSEIQQLKQQITEMSEHIEKAILAASLAAEASKASATIAYQASVENVKSNQDIQAKLDSYIKEDNEWKTRAEPVILLGNNALGASRALLWLTGIIVAVGGAFLMIKNFFHHN